MADHISIAMATYNGARFLREQLNSIAGQSVFPDELIITDDCSTDETASIVEGFTSSAPFEVRFHRNEARLGFNRNFERALSLCRGEIMLISDQDDIWYPKKIETVANAFASQTEILALVHDEHILDNSRGRALNTTFIENAKRLGYWDREILSGNCTAIRRALLDLLMPFPDGINYDYWIGWVSDILGVRTVLREPLQAYRRHGLNSSDPVLAEDQPSRLTIFMRSGMNDPRPEWSANIQGLSLVADRIAERRTVIDELVGDGRAASALEQIQKEIDGFEERTRITSLPKWRRIPKIVRRWREGFYKNYSGYKSAVKDAVRP